MKCSIQIYLAALPYLICLFYLLAALYFPKIYIYATYEDLYGEWMQTFCFAVAAVFFLKLARPAQENIWQRRFFGLLTMACAYVVLEEISWGQRLFELATPDFFAQHSYQDETNLHNLLTGPVDSPVKTALTYLVSAGLIGYGLIYPALFAVQIGFAKRLNQWGVAAPPLVLAGYFILGAICELELFSFNEAEVAELLVAMGLAHLAIYWSQQNNPANHLFRAFITPIIGALLLAGVMTQVLLHAPLQRHEIDQRLVNGYEKFADRYERYHRYAQIAEVLENYDQLKPGNTVILRRLAHQYDLLGWDTQRSAVLQRAANVAEMRYKNDPEHVPTAVSLAKTYYQLNLPARALAYAQQAYKTAKQHYDAENADEHAYWAYWLAKSAEQINDQPQALTYFYEAYQLEPENRRYRNAYYEKKQRMADYYEE